MQGEAAHVHNTSSLFSQPSYPLCTHVFIFHFFLLLPLHLSLLPSVSSLHLYSAFYSFVVAASLAYPYGCAPESSISKRFPAVGACFTLCLSAIQAMYLHICSPIYGACYMSEHSLLIFALKAVFPRGGSHVEYASLFPACKGQAAQIPVCIVMVPAYAQDAVLCAVFCLVIPVGCFHTFPTAALCNAHVSISPSALCSCAIIPNLCLSLFLQAVFPRWCKPMYLRHRGIRPGSGVI